MDDPPVLLLGGSTGTLAVARELADRGVEVHVSMRKGRPELRTNSAAARFPYRDHDEADALWKRLLLDESPSKARPRYMVLPCDDDAVEFVAANYDALRARHILDIAQRLHLTSFLDKELTSELVQGTGVNVPRIWKTSATLDAATIIEQTTGGVIVKPVHSHHFQRIFGRGGRKYFQADDAEELRTQLARLAEADVEALVMERVPGPDLCSFTYYTYRTAEGVPLFEFIKQVLRRYPRNEGPGSLHVVAWNEEVARESRRLLDAVGFTGYANIEFKRHEGDGRMMLIELNPRFTASQELLRRAGIPAASIVVDHLRGRNPGAVPKAREGLLLWDPVRDLRAFREHRRAEGLTLRGWLSSLRGERVPFLFRASDPRPFLARVWQVMLRSVGAS